MLGGFGFKVSLSAFDIFSLSFCKRRKRENMKVCSVGSFGAMERFYGVKPPLPAIEVWKPHTWEIGKKSRKLGKT